jgi:hypothetical protein
MVSKCLNLKQSNNGTESEIEKVLIEVSKKEEIKSCNNDDKECLEKEENSTLSFDSFVEIIRRIQ